MNRLVVVALLVTTVAVPTHAQVRVAEPSTIELTVGDNMRFTPAVIQSPPGKRVGIVLKAVGKLAALSHNVVFLPARTPR